MTGTDAVRSLCSGRTLIALCGAPASGKTTLADECADLATVVSVDRLRSTGRGGTLDPFGPKATRRAFNTAYRLVDEALSQDRAAVLDSTASSRAARASILRLAAKHDAVCRLVVLDEPLSTLLERNTGRDDPCPDDVLRKLHTTLTAGLKGIGAEGFDGVLIGGEGRLFEAVALGDPAPRRFSPPEPNQPQRQARERARERRRQRPTTAQRGYGHRHKTLRKQLAPVVAAGEAYCWRCLARGKSRAEAWISPDEPWDLGHNDEDRTRYMGPEHRRCNRDTASRTAAKRKGRKGGLGNQSRRW